MFDTATTSARAVSFGIALAAAALLPVCSASAANRDTAMTQRYLRAELSYMQAQLRAFPASQQAAEGFVKKAAGECPGVLAGAPMRASLLEIGAEIGGSLGKAMETPAVESAETSFVRVAGSLRWSNPSVSRSVASLVALLGNEASLPVPELCTDLRSWVTSGYEKVPAAAERYFRLVAEEASVPSRSTIRSRLRRYETASLRSLAKRVSKLEGELDAGSEALAVVGVSELNKVLGLP